MKIRIVVTVDLDKEQIKTLVRGAKATGHNYAGVKAPGKLIRRLLEARVTEAVVYCRELYPEDTPNEEEEVD